MSKALIWFKKVESKFDDIPKRPGVYVISCKCKDGNDHAIYVGQSIDLQGRIKEHWSESESNKDLKSAISKYPGSMGAYYAEAGKGDLDGIERYLFDHFEPQFTDRAPQEDPIVVILPNVKKGRVNF